MESLKAVGIDLRQHDIKFEEDNWESPTLGAWGIGWQVMFDGLEITQFTYFQQAGGIELSPISAELTYGLERIAMVLQRVDSVYDLEWAPGVKYGDVRLRDEIEQSKYVFGLVRLPGTSFGAFHRDPFEPIGQFRRNRGQLETAGLLKVGELRNFQTVEHHLPADTPGAQRRRFPVVFLEADVVLPRVDPACFEAFEIELLHFVW